MSKEIFQEPQRAPREVLTEVENIIERTAILHHLLGISGMDLPVFLEGNLQDSNLLEAMFLA
jgi:hypothetical protein